MSYKYDILQMDKMKIVHQLIETSNLYNSSDETNSEIEELSSSTNSSVTSSSSDENHDLLLFLLLHYLTTGFGRKKHRIENYLLIIDSWRSRI